MTQNGCRSNHSNLRFERGQFEWLLWPLGPLEITLEVFLSLHLSGRFDANLRTEFLWDFTTFTQHSAVIQDPTTRYVVPDSFMFTILCIGTYRPLCTGLFSLPWRVYPYKKTNVLSMFSSGVLVCGSKVISLYITIYTNVEDVYFKTLSSCNLCLTHTTDINTRLRRHSFMVSEPPNLFFFF